MRRIFVCLVVLLGCGGWTWSEESVDEAIAKAMRQLSAQETVRHGSPAAFVVSCEDPEAVDFLRASFAKSTVRGWTAAAIISHDMRDARSMERDSMGGCELDTYPDALYRLPLESMKQPEPPEAEGRYLILPPMPATFFERSQHQDDSEEYYFPSAHKG